MEEQDYPKKVVLNLKRGGVFMEHHGGGLFLGREIELRAQGENPREESHLVGPGCSVVLPDPDDTWENPGLPPLG